MGRGLVRVVERSRELLGEKSPLSLGFYTTGQPFLEEYYTFGVIGKAGLGAPHMDGNTRLCTATAGQAKKESFGTDGQPGSCTDVDHPDAIVLFGLLNDPGGGLGRERGPRKERKDGVRAEDGFLELLPADGQEPAEGLSAAFGDRI